jgi:hypothetical protein
VPLIYKINIRIKAYGKEIKYLFSKNQVGHCRGKRSNRLDSLGSDRFQKLLFN